MATFLTVLSVLLCGALSFPLNHFLRKKGISVSWIFYYLFWLLPFLAGGFHTYTAPLSFLVLSAALFQLAHTRKALRIYLNLNTIAVFLIVLGYCLSPIWAADRGMAVFGIVRFLTVFLLSVVLMQFSAEEKQEALVLIPFCGAFMTVLSILLLLFPSCAEIAAVNGRLSGFFQYPNAYASFLLVAIAVLGTEAYAFRGRWILLFLLLAGLYLSGSRTAIILLAIVLPGIAAVRKKLQPIYAGLIFLSSCFFTAASILMGGDLIGRDTGSAFVRLLYYLDAIPVIGKHPFGIGYMGYRAMEASFQTSRYTVSFVHNSLLQLMLDIGWIPALFFSFSILSGLLSQKLSGRAKLMILTLILHSLLEFTMEFFLFWCILLVLMHFETGKHYEFKHPKNISLLTVPLLLLCLWLGAGDLLYHSVNVDAALKLTPFHTDAMAYKLTQLSNVQELDSLSDRILSLNASHSLAYGAKANAALAKGEVNNMILFKEKAIACAPYSIEEYCDYMDKLYALLIRYMQMGDPGSAEICRDKLLAIPKWMQKVSDSTHPLARLTTVDTQMALPHTYQMLIHEIQSIEIIPQ